MSRILGAEKVPDLLVTLDVRLRIAEGEWHDDFMASVTYIEMLKIRFNSYQRKHYKVARFCAFRGVDTKFQPNPMPAQPPWKGDRPELVPNKEEMTDGLEWLRATDDHRGTGRTYLLAVCFLEKGIANPEERIGYFDHCGNNAYDIDAAIKNLVFADGGLHARTAFRRIEFVIALEGATEIVIGR